MTHDLVPAADAIALHVRAPARNEYVALGVYGYPHFGSTQVTPIGNHFGQMLEVGETQWARTPGEVQAVYACVDATPAAERFLRIHASVSASPHRSLIRQPCLLDAERLACLWVENWSKPSAFH